LTNHFPIKLFLVFDLSFFTRKMSHPCEAKCGRYFASIKSMNSHLTSARSCSWYTKERLRDLGVNDGVSLSTLIAPDLQVHIGVEGEGQGYDPQQDPDIAMDFGPYGDELQFLPGKPEEIEAETQPQTTHLKYTVLAEDEAERITIVDEDAGRIFRREAPPRYPQVDREGDTLMEEGGEPNPFAPFSSELDWRVAQWAVKDGPGHNAFNRFLEIPGVSNLNETSFCLCNII
jgi:hypothetical protein